MMKHFSCDSCGKVMMADGELRYVVRMQITASGHSDSLQAADLDQNQLDAMAEYLEELEETGATLSKESSAAPSEFEFDLCPSCLQRWMKDPLGREQARKWRFSAN